MMTDNGILILNKPAGMTSHDAVNKIRRLYGTRQVGHVGTLDPMATGVLCVLIGRAVKASEYAVLQKKTYRAGLKLGLTTDTEDISGKLLSHTVAPLPSKEEVIAASSSFLGEGSQIPPMYSALKRGGEKLCDLARKGVTVEREPRPITVYSLSCEAVNEEAGDYSLTVCCSKGTYIRTLCADIGAKLGCGGVMSSLLRLETGDFSLSQSHTLEELEALSQEARKALLLPLETLFADLPILRLPGFFARLALDGNEIYLSKLGLAFPEGQRLRLYDDSFFSLGEVRLFEKGLAVKPIKKFRL